MARYARWRGPSSSAAAAAAAATLTCMLPILAFANFEMAVAHAEEKAFARWVTAIWVKLCISVYEASFAGLSLESMTICKPNLPTFG